MVEEFKKFIDENDLIKQGDKILLAVSGGVDSMVMAHIFSSLKYNIGIAHCNFSLRGIDSDKDEELVRQFAENCNIPFHSKRFDTKSFAKNNGLSIQMAARDLRYEWFEEIRSEYGYDLVAIAHNLNDNIETLLINLTRGTGLTGMTGIKPVSNKVIRPLLFATRQKISSYCNRHKIEFREDKSNAETKYTRNKIRHLVIPVLKEINPSIETTLNETAERFSGFNEIVNEYISQLKEKIFEEKDQYISVNISLLDTHINNKVVLFELFRPYGLTNSVLNDLIQVIEGKTGGQIITETHRIIKNRKELIVTEKEAEKETIYLIDDVESLCNFPGINSAKSIRITSKTEIPSDSSIACIDMRKITFPLTIRKWKPGDYFYPLGMKQKKKLSDYFINRKYSLIDKEKIFILESDGNIVWIIGERLDDRFKITESTKSGLIIRSKKKSLEIKPIK